MSVPRCLIFEPPGGAVTELLRAELSGIASIIRVDFAGRSRQLPNDLLRAALSGRRTPFEPGVHIGIRSQMEEVLRQPELPVRAQLQGYLKILSAENLIAHLAPLAIAIVVTTAEQLVTVMPLVEKLQAGAECVAVVLERKRSPSDKFKKRAKNFSLYYEAPEYDIITFGSSREASEVLVLIRNNLVGARLGLFFDFKHEAFFSGFYESESNGPSQWRWSGMGHCSGISVFCPPGGNLTLELPVVGKWSEDVVFRASAVTGGQVQALTSSQGQISGKVFVDGEAELCHVKIFIEVSCIGRPPGAVRDLGICISPPRLAWNVSHDIAGGRGNE